MSNDLVVCQKCGKDIPQKHTVSLTVPKYCMLCYLAETYEDFEARYRNHKKEGAE